MTKQLSLCPLESWDSKLRMPTNRARRHNYLTSLLDWPQSRSDSRWRPAFELGKWRALGSSEQGRDNGSVCPHWKRQQLFCLGQLLPGGSVSLCSWGQLYPAFEVIQALVRVKLEGRWEGKTGPLLGSFWVLIFTKQWEWDSGVERSSLDLLLRFVISILQIVPLLTKLGLKC